MQFLISFFKKINFIFLLGLLVFYNFSFLLAETNSASCTSKDLISFTRNYYSLRVNNIEIKINNYKKWTVNNIKILTNLYRFTPEALKKRFKGKVRVVYEDSTICEIKAEIRHSGDAKDHIALKDDNVIQSLDVKLLNGNVKGITEFKLFKQDVRGNIDDVIIQNQILTNFGYLAPRSYKVSAITNKSKSIMLLQEKATKELLEFNNRREGPILEGDQKYFFSLVNKIPDNNLSNWSVGLPKLRSKSAKAMLSKSTNAKMIDRSYQHKLMFINAMTDLNYILLYWSNRFQDEKNDYYFFDYDLDNELLAKFEKKNIINLDIFNLFLQSTNSHHAFAINQRKFYWNSINDYFEPILYDANPDIDSNFSKFTTQNLRLPVSKYFFESFEQLENKLKNINIEELYNQVQASGLDKDKIYLEKKIDKILVNLSLIKENYFNNLKEDLRIHNKYRETKDITKLFNTIINDIDSKAVLIKFDIEKQKFEKCKVYYENCTEVNLDNKKLAKLLEGELKIDNLNYQFVGNTFDLKLINKFNYNFNKINLNETSIFYDNGINIEIDNQNKKILINQISSGSKIFFINGILKNYEINFNGLDLFKNFKDNPKFFPPNFPINLKNFTGCVSFVNLKLEDIKINAKNSTCEDAINLVNVKGSISRVKIDNSFRDALDVDFSNLNIKEVFISNALNDCTDFSSGLYKLGSLSLKNCSDKGLSIGEGSKIDLDIIKVDNSETGIAIKDSSFLNLTSSSLTNLKTCVSAYNKKQEFYGGYAFIKEINCKKYNTYVDIDSKSAINFDNK